MEQTRLERCVSILIPIYNAGAFLEKSIMSALAQPETGEVVIVDDGSTDNSLSLCRALAQKDDRVKVLQHPNGENRGNIASRQLLIQNMSCKYAAFLDADDYFLPDRFPSAVSILEENPAVDGVYQAYENFYDDPGAQKDYLAKTNQRQRLRMPHNNIEPTDLLRMYLLHKAGIETLWQLTLRSSAFKKLDTPFIEDIRIGGDTYALMQMCALLHLVAGDLDKPIIMRRLHENNINASVGRDTQYHIKKANSYRTLVRYMRSWATANLPPDQQEYIAGFVIQSSWYLFPFAFSHSWRPYSVFKALRPVGALLALIWLDPMSVGSQYYLPALRSIIANRGQIDIKDWA
jgi:glycosyltransferase involved in cell wall biosynthesis